MSQASIPLTIDPGPSELAAPESAPAAPPSPARLRDVVVREHAFVWRSLRRLGVHEGDVDDAVQKVFLVAARSLGPVPASRERAFLFSTSVRIASNERRGEARRRSAGSEPLEALTVDAASPETVAHQRALLDRLLEPLPLDLRSVLVLYELEQLTVDEIAELLDVPVGTVASRIRRARDQVLQSKKRMHAKHAFQPGDEP